MLRLFKWSDINKLLILSWPFNGDQLLTRYLGVSNAIPWSMAMLSIPTKQANPQPRGEILLGTNGLRMEHTNLYSVQCCLAFYGISGVASFATSATYRPKKCAAT